jgi:vacuolar-type H+-ATPase subunit H
MSMYEDRTLPVGSSAREVVETARDAGADVARTATDEARHVAREATDQAHRVSIDVKQRMRDEIDKQHRNVTERVGAFAEELYFMAGQQPQTPARELVRMLAVRSSAFANYLDEHGPETVLHEVQEFARRHPARFIAAAVAAGFVVGRVGKGLWQNERHGSSS